MGPGEEVEVPRRAGEAVHEDGVAPGNGLLDEARHQDAAPQVDVVAEVEARGGRAEAQLCGLGGLSWRAAADGPLGPRFHAHGRVAVRLQAAREVVEAARVRHRHGHGHVAARGEPVGEERRGHGHLVGERVPRAPALLLWRVRRRRDAVLLLHQRLKLNHARVVVEEGDGGRAAEPEGERRDGREDAAFGHGCGIYCVSVYALDRVALVLMGIKKGDASCLVPRIPSPSMYMHSHLRSPAPGWLLRCIL